MMLSRPEGAERLTPTAAAIKLVRQYLEFLIVAFVVWQVVTWLFRIPGYLLPAPVEVLRALGSHGGAVASATLFTISCTLLGMAVSVVVAALLAILFLRSEIVARAVMPALILVRTVPVIAIAPLTILVFGRGRWNSVGIVALLTFFQIMLAAYRGFRSPSKNSLELMHVYGSSFLQTLVKVRLPFALPYLFTGVRIASGSAALCAMFAEWLSGAPGLGKLLFDSYSTQAFPLMWATVLVGTTTAYLLLTLTTAIECAVLGWGE